MFAVTIALRNELEFLQLNPEQHDKKQTRSAVEIRSWVLVLFLVPQKRLKNAEQYLMVRLCVFVSGSYYVCAFSFIAQVFR